MHDSVIEPPTSTERIWNRRKCQFLVVHPIGRVSQVWRPKFMISRYKTSIPKALFLHEKSSTQARLDAYTYPVLTLPNEIIGELFTQFLPPYPVCPPSTGLLSPTILTQICGTWRQLALATPALWRAVWLPSGNPDSVGRIEVLMAWLTRSRSLPLSIRMECGGYFNQMSLVDWALIVPHRLRWEYLEVRTGKSVDLGFLDSSMPLLRRLDIWLDLWMREYYPRAVTIHQAPQLRTATLAATVSASTCVILPWAQLTSLTCVYDWECGTILKQTPSLVHCVMALFSPDGPTDQEPINPLYLQWLALSKFSPGEDAVTDLLEKFIAPALCTLPIPDEFLAPGPIHALSSFLEISGCQLKNVCITGRRSLSRASYRAAFPSVSFSFKRRLFEYSRQGVPDDDSDVESDESDEEEDEEDEEDD